MEVRKLLFFIIIFSRLSSFAEIDPAIVNMCSLVAKTPSIATVIKNIYWPSVTPVPPYGGVVIGLTSDTNVVIDICDFVLSFETWDTNQKIHGSKRLLNDITGRKFQEDFDFVDKTFNIANSVYDFENGEQRPGFLESEQSNREFNDYIRDLNEYRMNKQMSEKERQQIANEYYSQMDQFKKLVEKRSNIESAINCPDASNNPKYGKIYTEKIRPEEEIRQSAVRDIEYFKEKLNELAQFMYSGDYGPYRDISYEIDKLESNAIYLNTTQLSYNEETYKANKKLKDKNGKPIVEKKILTKNYQNFEAKMHSESFSNFKNKYSEIWKKAVKWEYLKNSTEYGVFAGAGERVENKFRNYTYECSERRLMDGYDPSKPDYDAIYEKKSTSCRENVAVDEKKIENLLSFYLIEYQNALYKEKKSLAKIWTYESRYLGTTRLVSQSNGSSDFLTENVKCSDQLSIAEMQKLSSKQESIGNEIKEIIAKNKIKKNIRKEEEKKTQVKTITELKRRQELIDQKNEKNKNMDKINPGIMPVKTQLGGRK